AAHAMWWCGVEPLLARAGWRTVVVELSGHGDSDRRPRYQPDTWAREVAAITRAEAGGPGLLVGHSMGGRVALWAAAREPALFTGLILVDTPVRRPVGARTGARLPRRTSRYPTAEDALARFRLVPDHGGVSGAVLRQVAAHGLARYSDEWGWK